MKKFYITKDYLVFDDVAKASIHVATLHGREPDGFTIAISSTVEDSVFYTIAVKE